MLWFYLRAELFKLTSIFNVTAGIQSSPAFCKFYFVLILQFCFQPNFVTRSHLSSRAPVRKDEAEEELRRWPATKVIVSWHDVSVSSLRVQVLVPAALHSESCSSLFSEWDIDCEDPGETGECRSADQEAQEIKRRFRRAPIVSFRNSYILSDSKVWRYCP